MEDVLQKIAEEKLNQTGVLDLSYEYFDKIPEELLQLKHLRSLNLSENSYISDYSFWEKLPNLQSNGRMSCQ